MKQRAIFIVALVVAAACLFALGFMVHDIVSKRVAAADGPRLFHTIEEFNDWRPSLIEYTGDCDHWTEAFVRIAAEDGYILGMQFVGQNGMVGGVQVVNPPTYRQHMGVLVLTDTEVWYFDWDTPEPIFISVRD